MISYELLFFRKRSLYWTKIVFIVEFWLYRKILFERSVLYHNRVLDIRARPKAIFSPNHPNNSRAENFKIHHHLNNEKWSITTAFTRMGNIFLYDKITWQDVRSLFRIIAMFWSCFIINLLTIIHSVERSLLPQFRCCRREQPIWHIDKKRSMIELRLLSLICEDSEMMKRLIAFHLKEYFVIKRFLSQRQYGSLRNRSTTQNCSSN